MFSDTRCDLRADRQGRKEIRMITRSLNPQIYNFLRRVWNAVAYERYVWAAGKPTYCQKSGVIHYLYCKPCLLINALHALSVQ